MISYSRRDTRKYCSDSCARLGKRNRVSIKCRICSKVVVHRKTRPGKYCSHKCYWEGRLKANLDFAPWNLGKSGYSTAKKGRKYGPLSNAHKKKLSLMRRGAKRKRKYPTGPDHPMWKGGDLRRARQIARTTKEYKWLRRKVYSRDNYTCIACGKGGDCLHMDHIKSWEGFPKLRYKASNCRTLCRKCHYLRTYGKKMPKGSKWGITNGSFIKWYRKVG